MSSIRVAAILSLLLLLASCATTGERVSDAPPPRPSDNVAKEVDAKSMVARLNELNEAAIRSSNSAGAKNEIGLNAGLGIPKLELPAVRQAAEQGDANAAFRLARYYWMLEKADEMWLYYRKAANAGHVIAQNNLGVLLSLSPRSEDKNESILWLERAASNGHPEAQRAALAVREKTSNKAPTTTAVTSPAAQETRQP